MQPKDRSNAGRQLGFFQTRLDDLIDVQHPLCKLADAIDWSVFNAEFGALYVESVGRPGLPIRMMVGLHYLKYTYDLSDQGVLAGFLENPYWQYFCGNEYFEHSLPLDESSLTRWRKRIGAGGVEKLLLETLETAKRGKQLTSSHLERVNVDTTAQEKAIAFPTDSRLYYKMLLHLVKLAKRHGIALRQSYVRIGKKALTKQGRYGHARQLKRARREQRKLKTYLGRVVRDIDRKAAGTDRELREKLAMAQRLLGQQRYDSNKLYSVHAPEVECISKGKAHKKYEFGCKVAVVSTSKDNWAVGIEALHGNPYDGHTLEGSLRQVERLTGVQPASAYVDKGYRGNTGTVNNTEVHIARSRGKSMSRNQWLWYKRRSAIEPIIGHLKSDCRMDRNRLKGKEGDRINALLAASGYNMRKLLRAFFLFIFRLLNLESKLLCNVWQPSEILLKAA
jgi:IS5 family transposase